MGSGEWAPVATLLMRVCVSDELSVSQEGSVYLFSFFFCSVHCIFTSQISQACALALPGCAHA